MAVTWKKLAYVTDIVTTFIGLTDTPASYSGQAGKILKVNATPDALEFLSFALSNLSIDANKDWAGKNITNLGAGTHDVNARLGELVTARGSKASLDARLDVSLKEDGNLKGNPVIKAWISFNGTGTIAIRDSYNVSSIVDNGTGDYTINWDTNFANTGYAITTGVVKYDTTGNPDSQLVVGKTNLLPSVGSCRLYVGRGTTKTDIPYVALIAIGDQ